MLDLRVFGTVSQPFLCVCQSPALHLSLSEAVSSDLFPLLYSFRVSIGALLSYHTILGGLLEMCQARECILIYVYVQTHLSLTLVVAYSNV